ncbi:TetR/AcrR family transcriptional regulator [Actinocorallia populi]|uniref:TetR/AcrR family transcriptional regulator n=1 Tax=Actinocorallia populi TaxID=2079200 RepID=UPI000D096466|nr:TetR/AcrR family transcriptional regulator [Actinocorallia populi]
MAAETVQEAWADLPPTAQRLLMAALDAFGEQGYHGTSTRQVALRAGMSPAAMYMHFATKEALLYEIARTGHEVNSEQVRRACEEHPDPVERVRAIVEVMVSFHAEHHTLARVVQYEHTSLSPARQRELIVIRRRTEAFLREAIDEGVAAGLFEAAAAPMATTAIMSLAIDVARWYPSQRSRGADQITAAYADLALRMLASR